MTDDELEAIEARANAATPEPWKVKLVRLVTSQAMYVDRIDGPDIETECGWSAISIPDAEFIAAARTDIPALIAEVRRLREERTVFVVIEGYDQMRFAGVFPTMEAAEKFCRIRGDERGDYLEILEIIPGQPSSRQAWVYSRERGAYRAP